MSFFYVSHLILQSVIFNKLPDIAHTKDVQCDERN